RRGATARRNCLSCSKCSRSIGRAASIGTPPCPRPKKPLTPTIPLSFKRVNLLEVKNLKVYFPVKHGLFSRVKAYVKAVDDVSLTVAPGETLGLVGESGCGKTTLGRAIIRLIDPTAGKVFFDGDDITELRGAELRRRRRKFQMIF